MMGNKPIVTLCKCDDHLQTVFLAEKAPLSTPGSMPSVKAACCGCAQSIKNMSGAKLYHERS